MAKPKKVLPQFQSEAEEIAFWDANDPGDWVEGPADIIVALKRQPKKTITMRLDEPLYDRLREVADKHGIPYQRLMRELLRQSLQTLEADERRKARAGV